MNTIAAFTMGQAYRGSELKVFDWNKAAKLIKESKTNYASAGLDEDWEWTGGEIYRDNKPVTDNYTYLASTWATPKICIDDEFIDCYKMEHEVPDWNAETKWPESALKILNEEESEDKAIGGEGETNAFTTDDSLEISEYLRVFCKPNGDVEVSE